MRKIWNKSISKVTLHLLAWLGIGTSAMLFVACYGAAPRGYAVIDEDDSIKSSLVIQIKHYKDFVVTIDDYEFIVEDMGDYYDLDETRLSTDETVSFADFVSAAASDSDEYSFFRNEIDYSLFDSLDGIDEVYNELKSIGDIPAQMKLTIYEKDGVIENYSID